MVQYFIQLSWGRLHIHACAARQHYTPKVSQPNPSHSTSRNCHPGDAQNPTIGSRGKYGSPLMLIRFSLSQLCGLKDGSIINQNEVVLLSFFRSPHIPILFQMCLPFPFAHSLSTERTTKIPTISRAGHSTLSFSLPSLLFSGGGINPKRIPKPTPIPANRANSETIT